MSELPEAIFIEETDETPKVHFDAEKNIFEIEGKSLPEDATGFYDPIQEWLEKYVKNPNPKTEFDLKLEYFNSASASKILKLLIVLEDLNKVENATAKINWYFDRDDDLIKKRGKEIMEIIEVPVELKPC